MVIGAEKCVIALGPSEDLQGSIGNHLVHIHVERGSSAGLENVYNELICHLPGQNLITGSHNGPAPLFIQPPQFLKGHGSAPFYHRVGSDEEGMGLPTAHREVFRGSPGLNAVIGF